MRHLNRRSTQSGVVLVIGLLLLLIITIVAVASMSNTHMQERMAGNARTQALAFEVASAGASNSLTFFSNNRADIVACSTSANWDANAVPTPPQPEFYEIGANQVGLTQQLYCLERFDDPSTPLPPHYFVLSIGEVFSGTTPIARRAIEVRIEAQPASTLGQNDPDCGALCFLGCGEYQFPTSNAFYVDGNGSPAITTPEACREGVRDAIRDNRIGNYEGGIAGADTEFAKPWTSPETVDEFRKALLAQLTAGVSGSFPIDAEDPPSTEPFNITSKTETAWTGQFINPSSGGTFVDSGSTTYGTRDDPQITYIAGNADMRGTVSGAGILIVEGELEWRGTPPFEGLILVLGGQFKVGGGGTGGNFAGSLVVVDIWNDYAGYAKGATYLSPKFGPISLDFRGGGTALYQYDCEFLAGISGDLGFNELDNPWNPQCGGSDENGTEELAEIHPRLVSWRENIGWRIDFAN